MWEKKNVGEGGEGECGRKRMWEKENVGERV